MPADLYTPKRVQGRRLEGSNIVKANVIGGLGSDGSVLLCLQSAGRVPSADRPVPAAECGADLFVERNVVRITLMRMPPERAEPEAHSAGRLQPGGGGVHRPYRAESAVGLQGHGHSRRQRAEAGTDVQGHRGDRDEPAALSALLEDQSSGRDRDHAWPAGVLQAGTHRRDVRKGRGATRNLFRITARSFRQSHIRRICSVLRSSTSVTFRFPTRLI